MGHRRLSRRVLAIVAAVTVALSGIQVAVASQPAAAVSAQDFKPGNIISDGNFYNGSAMSASDVQSFLNQRLATCKIGKAPYLPGADSPIGGGPIGKSCLKDFRMTTTSRAADAYCNAYVGKANESAAEIIAKVGQACGISQRVILVMLEKEQSLVTDDWPLARQYNYAMGMDCPDSGPGNSANCDSAGAGFFLQVMRGARQLKVYRAHPDSFNYKANRNNTIQWHPNQGCGTSQVYIENNATAALYIYTPYRPNQAALNAGWGTGDGCSTYGNRNFFLFYANWFGSPTAPATPSGPSVTGPIKALYDANPAMYGKPIENQASITANGGGLFQRFESGMITHSNALNKTVGIINGSFSAAWLAAGGPSGSWGFLANEKVLEPRSGATLRFQHGTATWTSALGVRFIPSPLAAGWDKAGGVSGALGYPIADAVMTSSTSGTQAFEGGILSATNSTSVILSETTLARWRSLGNANTVGVPLENVQQVAGGSWLRTDRGAGFFRDGAKPLFIANGLFINAYLAAGGPTGSWGWPTVGKTLGLPNGGSTVTFQNGVAVHTHATGVVYMPKAAYDYWIANGGPTGSLGYPTESGTHYPDGASMKFGASTVFFGPKATIRIDPGMFINAYLESGGPTGPWGWPTVGKTLGLPNGGSTVTFQNGVAVHTHTTGVVYMPKAAYDNWMANGGPSGILGYPTESGTPYLDVPYTHQFATEISWLTYNSISDVAKGGDYRPDDKTTRAEIAQMLFNDAKRRGVKSAVNWAAPAVSPFKDVTPSALGYQAITWLAAQGITTGWSDGTFRPSNNVERGAIAAFFYRYAGKPAFTPTGKTFNDVSRTNQFFTEIDWMTSQEITLGWADNTFRPLENTDRGAMAAFIYRLNGK